MKAAFTRFGPKYDYRAAHVALDYRQQRLLGTIINVRYDEVLSVIIADVQHFCGDPWPITPRLAALEILKRNQPCPST